MQNKYDVLGVVGEGAYGIVYKCKNKETGKYVAIKRFKEVEDDLVKKTMKRELKMLQKLHHPNVVDFQEAYKRKGNLYLVFEFVDKNLLELLQEHPQGLDPDLIRYLIYQLCKAIKYMHDQNIIHRDVKPENLLITENMELKLCDFGFSRLISGSCTEKLTDYVATRWYRAPELLLTQGEYGKEVDYWAIGCIMGELVDGNPLFPGENEIDQIYCIQKVLGNLTEEQMNMFYNNPLFNGKDLLNVMKPETLQRRYMGKLNKTDISFMKGLLELDPKKRLNGNTVFSHPYFEIYEGKKNNLIKKNSSHFLSAHSINTAIIEEEKRNISKNKNNENNNNNKKTEQQNNNNSELLKIKIIQTNNNQTNCYSHSIPNSNKNVINKELIDNTNDNNLIVVQNNSNTISNINNNQENNNENNNNNKQNITNITNISIINYNNYENNQNNINNKKNQKKDSNKNITSNINTKSKKNIENKMSTSINFNKKFKNNLNLMSFGNGVEGKNYNKQSMANDNVNNILDNAYKTFYKKNKDKDIYNIELDLQNFDHNGSNDNIKNYMQGAKYDTINEEEELTKDEKMKLKQLASLYKTNNNKTNKNNNNSSQNKFKSVEKNLGKNKYFHKGSPPKNHINKGHSKNSLHLPVIPKGSIYNNPYYNSGSNWNKKYYH
jgi:cyclin-dependent kinase-like